MLLFPDLPNGLKLSTVPIFWNRLMNPNGSWFLGLWNDARHPALAGFPTESHCDWQWVDLLPASRAMVIDELPPGLQPIVQPIDDWNRNLKLAMLYECRVGPGRLMVCSFDLSTQRPGAGSLMRSMLNYIASADFKPAFTVSAADLEKALHSGLPSEGTAQPAASSSQDLVDPGQVNRTPSR